MGGGTLSRLTYDRTVVTDFTFLFCSRNNTKKSTKSGASKESLTKKKNIDHKIWQIFIRIA